jgi:DNA-binding NarL/FixJ family response regulator
VVKTYIDTHSPVVRAGLMSLLEDRGGVEMVSSGREAEVVLRDHALGDRALTEDTRHPWGAVPVVLLSDARLTPRAFRQGVRAILPHHAEPGQIVAAIHAVAAGLVAVPAEGASLLTSVEAFGPETEALTPREADVLEMLAEGLSNKQIAGRLAISDHTAKFHVNSILGKLDAGTRTEAVAKGIRSGLLKV